MTQCRKQEMGDTKIDSKNDCKDGSDDQLKNGCGGKNKKTKTIGVRIW